MSYSSTVLGFTPGGYWRLGEASGTLADSSGNSNTGTASGSPTYAQTALLSGDAGKCLQFTAASSQRVAVTSAASVNPADTFTLMAWVKRTASAQNVGMGVCGKGNGSGQLNFNNDGTFYVARSQVAILASSTTTIPLADTTNAYMIAATKSGSTVNLYLNAADVTGAVTNSTCVTNTQHFYIGCDGGGSDTPVTFASLYIQEAAVWPTTALSAANITAIYNASFAAPSNSVAPAVTGTAQVGQVLTTTDGTWTDGGSPAFTYQWQRDTAGNLSFSNIAAATASTYTQVLADLGNKIRCVVTDTSRAQATAANSNAVGVVIAAAASGGGVNTLLRGVG